MRGHRHSVFGSLWGKRTGAQILSCVLGSGRAVARGGFDSWARAPPSSRQGCDARRTGEVPYAGLRLLAHLLLNKLLLEMLCPRPCARDACLILSGQGGRVRPLHRSSEIPLLAPLPTSPCKLPAPPGRTGLSVGATETHLRGGRCSGQRWAQSRPEGRVWAWE